MKKTFSSFRLRNVVVLVAGAVSTLAAWAVEPFTVRDIRVEGLQRVEHGLHGCKPQRFPVQDEVVLLAAERHEIQPKSLGGGTRCDAAIGLPGQYGVSRRQVTEGNGAVPAQYFFREARAAYQAI